MQKIIVGNLKMNISTVDERTSYLETFQQELRNLTENKTEIVLCPPFVHLEKFSEKIKNEKISFGGQNLFWEEKGSFTGEISAPMLKSLGCEYVLVGHSERRKYFAEDGEIVNAKIKMALRHQLKPIFCFGESRTEKENEKTAEAIIGQIQEGLAGVEMTEIRKIVLAYEPIWSIGSGLIPTATEILTVKVLIRKALMEKYGVEIAEKIRIIYGGSVNAQTVAEVCLKPQMDGVLVGRESLTPSEFLKIASIISRNNEQEAVNNK